MKLTRSLSHIFLHMQNDVYMPYAAWLVENDRFDEAQEGTWRNELEPAKVITDCQFWPRHCLLMQTADSCFGLFGPHQCGVAPGVDQQLLADQHL